MANHPNRSQGAVPHYLTFNGRPYCAHLGCVAGQALAEKASVQSCSYPSKAQAMRARRELRRHVYAEIRAVAGDCPA